MAVWADDAGERDTESLSSERNRRHVNAGGEYLQGSGVSRVPIGFDWAKTRRLAATNLSGHPAAIGKVPSVSLGPG